MKGRQQAAVGLTTLSPCPHSRNRVFLLRLMPATLSGLSIGYRALGQRETPWREKDVRSESIPCTQGTILQSLPAVYP